MATVSPLPPDHPHPRPRRADALRNVETILDAAARLLSQRPDASMDDIAKAAGTSRKTVYAHFPSRDALLSALIEQATHRVITALDAADLQTGPADQALVRFLETGWQSLDTDPFLLHLATPAVSPEEDRARHAPILDRLQQVITRGLHEGDIDPALPTNWILASLLALGHAAGEEVKAGRMSSAEAIESLRRCIPRMLRPD